MQCWIVPTVGHSLVVLTMIRYYFVGVKPLYSTSLVLDVCLKGADRAFSYSTSALDAILVTNGSAFGSAKLSIIASSLHQ